MRAPVNEPAVAVSSPPAAALAFDAQQARYWERDESYTDPTNPTAVASAAPKVAHLQQRLSLPRDTRVLDVGAGTGVFTQQLQREFDRVVSMDVAFGMLRRNPSSGARVQASAYDLPVLPNSFDVVFCANLLHHVADPLRAAREMARASSRYVVWCEPNRWNLPLLAFMALVPEERGGVKFRPAYLRRLAAGAGLEVLSCASMGLIYERATPAALLGYLRVFDRPCWYGAYTVLIAAKRGCANA